jgi:hypothetical protein
VNTFHLEVVDVSLPGETADRAYADVKSPVGEYDLTVASIAGAG